MASSVVRVGSAEQAAKMIAVITVAKIALAVRILDGNCDGLLLNGSGALIFDMRQVFPHVQHLHGVGRA